MKTLIDLVRHGWASLRLLLVFTVVLGVGYPLLITAAAQLPGLKAAADGSLLTSDGRPVASALIGQNFTDSKGNPLPQYFQSRPSAAGTAGYDPTATSASNLGPESIEDVLADPSDPGSGRASLLSQVCARSLAVGKLEGVDGSRPFCTPDGVGAVLAVFWSQPNYTGRITQVVSVNQVSPATPFLARYRGVAVQLARYGQDYRAAQLVPIRGDAPSHPVVPADAVTASASGLDPDISPAYAALQVRRVARVRGMSVKRVEDLVSRFTTVRALGFMGEPVVNVVKLNLALDRSGQ